MVQCAGIGHEGGKTLVYESFARWVEAYVLPLQRSNPTWHRLDGLNGGGNREIFGRFRYEDQIWEVHGDTHFVPVIRAYQAVRDEQVSDPFVVEQAKVRQCLNLKPELRNTQLPKHFYVYEQTQ